MTETIRIDGRNWQGLDDFYDALLAALQAPEWHGRSMDAIADSLVGGGINGIEPPLDIEIISMADPPALLKRALDQLAAIADEAQSINRAISIRFLHL